VGDHQKPLAVQSVVLLAVVKVLSDVVTDLYPQVLGQRQVALVQQDVQVRAQQDAIAETMRPRLGDRLDVRRAQDRECALR